MSFSRLLIQTVTVLTRSTTKDRYGNTVDDWSSPTTRSVSAWVAQTGSVEDLLGRDATTTVAVVFLPAGDPITAYDRVTLPDGVTYAVDGVPNPANSRRGVHHIVVKLRNVEG